MMRVGIIGGGAICRYVLERANEEKQQSFTVTSVVVRDVEKYAELAETYDVLLFDDLTQFLRSDIDVVVEATTIEAAREYVPTALTTHDVVVISIGAFNDRHFSTRVYDKAKKYKTRLFVPSGAIGGLDLIQHVAASNTVDEISLVTKKPAHTLTEEKLKEQKVIFEGTASEAVAKYPRNMNVSVALGLAGLGFSKTSVQLIADPTIQKNVHHIEARGDFGKASFEIENEPLKENPKSSYLAAISIVGTLENMNKALIIG